MTERLAIDGVGIVGGFGAGPEALRAAMADPQGPNASLAVGTPKGQIDYPVYQADPTTLRDWVGKGELRRAGRLSRLAALAACLALDAADAPVPARTGRYGVVVATAYGALAGTFRFLDTILDGETLASPTLFSNSVHSAAASDVTILLEITGPSLTVCQFEMSYVSALLSAARWLGEGRVDSVLVCAVDELNGLLGYCRHCFFGTAGMGPIRPEALHVDSAVAGEGAACLLLRPERTGQGRFGWIDRCEWAAGTPVLPPAGALVLGADGHRCCGRWYRPLIDQWGSFTSFAPLYGAVPSGQGFDVAIAAMAMSEGRLSGPVECLKAGPEGQWGRVRLAR